MVNHLFNLRSHLKLTPTDHALGFSDAIGGTRSATGAVGRWFGVAVIGNRRLVRVDDNRVIIEAAIINP
jgi:hypothetical protein